MWLHEKVLKIINDKKLMSIICTIVYYWMPFCKKKQTNYITFIKSLLRQGFKNAIFHQGLGGSLPFSFLWDTRCKENQYSIFLCCGIFLQLEIAHYLLNSLWFYHLLYLYTDTIILYISGIKEGSKSLFKIWKLPMSKNALKVVI